MPGMFGMGIRGMNGSGRWVDGGGWLVGGGGSVVGGRRRRGRGLAGRWRFGGRRRCGGLRRRRWRDRRFFRRGAGSRGWAGGFRGGGLRRRDALRRRCRRHHDGAGRNRGRVADVGWRGGSGGGCCRDGRGADLAVGDLRRDVAAQGDDRACRQQGERGGHDTEQRGETAIPGGPIDAGPVSFSVKLSCGRALASATAGASS